MGERRWDVGCSYPPQTTTQITTQEAGLKEGGERLAGTRCSTEIRRGPQVSRRLFLGRPARRTTWNQNKPETRHQEGTHIPHVVRHVLQGHHVCKRSSPTMAFGRPASDLCSWRPFPFREAFIYSPKYLRGYNGGYLTARSNRPSSCRGVGILTA